MGLKLVLSFLEEKIIKFKIYDIYSFKLCLNYVSISNIT